MAGKEKNTTEFHQLDSCCFELYQENKMSVSTVSSCSVATN